MSRSDEREYNAIALQAYYAVANRHHFLRGNMIETVGVDNMNMSMSEMVGVRWMREVEGPASLSSASGSTCNVSRKKRMEELGRGEARERRRGERKRGR